MGIGKHTVVKRANLLLNLRQRYTEKMQSTRSSALLLQMVDDLFSTPALDVSSASKRLNMTPRSAQLNVDKLIQSGILKEATGRRRNRIFVAAEIIDIIEAPEIK